MHHTLQKLFVRLFFKRVQLEILVSVFVSQSVKQAVGRAGHDVPRLDGRARAVVKIVPLLRQTVFGEGGVVSEPNVAVVVGHRKQIVQQLAGLRKHKGLHV